MIKLKLGGYVDENNKVMTQQELDDWIVKIQEENVRLKNALEWYIDHSCDNRLGSRVAREALGRC
jgi:hypothetical protein